MIMIIINYPASTEQAKEVEEDVNETTNYIQRYHLRDRKTVEKDGNSW